MNLRTFCSLFFRGGGEIEELSKPRCERGGDSSGLRHLEDTFRQSDGERRSNRTFPSHAPLCKAFWNL
ncbi:hypothetical protein SKAU_G00307490 [Synaphobranchus kaupii]|uniref:Uncharacterized protein n=1 Tax=Synaphobranchus kaupii TaxID=118154 RepID=A0A9Q1IL15_SYNKA|nr:hypothetical protein SKAU_G00307490 [Synaphobranchus kaupii]